MPKKSRVKRKKGTFSDLRLSVSRDYVMPVSRKSTLIIGAIGVVIILAFFLFDIFFQNSSLISNGPLSSNHANFERNCTACHTKFVSVINEKCSVCHEKYGDRLGVYTFAAHYVYRSEDLSRVKPSENEVACFTCHPEHLGRELLITDVPDARCLQCHKFGSFNDKHPQFDFAENKIVDSPNLKFPHIRHVNEVKKREQLIDIERACLYCHNPQPDGKNFQPINFERHCAACHLGGAVGTPFLQIRDTRNRRIPSVETLETIQKRRGPGTLWTLNANRNEFKERGGKVKKVPVYHQDPWIMENLKRLRQMVYPSPGLADLLKSSSELQLPAKNRLLYEEAIQTLRNYSTGLRARPEPAVQSDLVEIEHLLKAVEKELRDPSVSLDDTKFRLSTNGENTNLTTDQIARFNSFIDELTEPCQTCHEVAKATISRVQKDQRVLRRAEYNHRVHILQRRCLDCHTRIPFLEYSDTSIKVDGSIDNAGMQNIPTIETCQGCHVKAITSNRCIKCHLFHPNKTNRSSMLLYLD